MIIIKLLLLVVIYLCDSIIIIKIITRIITMLRTENRKRIPKLPEEIEENEPAR